MPRQKVTLEITKQKQWIVKSVTEWAGGFGPNVTGAGYRTLALALQKSIPTGWSHILNDYEDVEVTSITVKGKPMSNRRAYEILEKALAGGPLAYALPNYRRALGV